MWGLRLDVLESREERVHRWKRRRDENPYLFAPRPQRFGEGEAAAERIAVGVLVTEDQDLLVGVDQVLDLVVEMRLVALCGDYCDCSSEEVSP